jgi:hypothetical protein
MEGTLIRDSLHLADRSPVVFAAAWQLLALLVLVGAVWLNEALDWPEFFFGAPSATPDWTSASLLTGAVCLAALISIFPLYVLKRVARREAVTICSYCRRIQADPQSWERVEAFFAKKTFAAVSHGVCPDCSAKVMQDYRAGRKDAGARETVVGEMYL